MGLMTSAGFRRPICRYVKVDASTTVPVRRLSSSALIERAD
jgi:hypothetical protein